MKKEETEVDEIAKKIKQFTEENPLSDENRRAWCQLQATLSQFHALCAAYLET